MGDPRTNDPKSPDPSTEVLPDDGGSGGDNPNPAAPPVETTTTTKTAQPA